MLSFLAPLLAYLLSFPVMLITLFRVEIGIIYFITLVPFIAVVKKIGTFPQGHNFPDWLLLSIVLGWIIRTVRRGTPLFHPSPVNVYINIFIIGSILNLITFFMSNAFPPEVNLYVVKQWKNFMILPVLYLVGINCVDNEKIIKIMLVCLGVSLLGMSFNFHSTFRWLKTFHYSHEMRIGGPMIALGPNEMGIFFSIMSFFLFCVSYCVEDRRMKYFLIFCFLISLYPIVYSYSRSAYGCFLIGTVAVGLLKDRRLLLVFLCLVFLYSSLLHNSVVERIDSTFVDKNEVSDERMESSAVDVGGVTVDAVGRKGLWERAMGYFEEAPVLGIGFGAFLEREGFITHNMFSKILAEQGLVGFFIFSIFTAVVLYQSYILFRSGQSGLGRGIGFAIFVSTLLHLVGGIGGDISEYYNLMCVYWLFIGIVARYNANNGSISEEGIRTL